jgi:transcriptional regulator with XRE-family HTH domain
MESKIKSGKYMKALRKESGLSQTQLGNKIGISQGNISDIENNKYDISLSKFCEWCSILEIKDYNKLLLIQ